MFDPKRDDESDNDQALKDAILSSLIEKMEDVIGGSMKPADKGVAVEVAAPNKAGLKEGLEKASDVVDAGSADKAEADEPSGDEHESPEGEESDEDRLLKLLEEDEDGKKR